MPEVLTHIEHQLTTRRIHKRRDFAIEVGTDAVAHVRLYQPFQPIGRLRVRMKLIDWLSKRLHRLVWVDAEVGKAIRQREEVAVLGRRHACQSGLVFHSRSHRGIRRQTLERHKFAIRKHAEKVDEGGPVRRIGQGRIRRVERCRAVDHGGPRVATQPW